MITNYGMRCTRFEADSFLGGSAQKDDGLCFRGGMPRLGFTKCSGRATVFVGCCTIGVEVLVGTV
jgi:hypothetical protein